MNYPLSSPSIRLLASTVSVKDPCYSDEIAARINHLELFGGRAAGICYAETDVYDDAVWSEDKATPRVRGCIRTGHHSTQGLGNIAVYLTGIPKLLAMILNNQQVNNTLERSFRYTRATGQTPREQELYTKWYDIAYAEYARLSELDTYPTRLTTVQIGKMSQEIARGMLSIWTPVTMAYSCTWQNWNYLLGWLEEFQQFVASSPMDSLAASFPMPVEMSVRLAEAIDRFLQALPPPLRNESIADLRNRRFSFLSDTKYLDVVQQYGEMYKVTYTASWACMAQLQRHKSINYKFTLYPEFGYSIPELFMSNEKHRQDWLEDAQSVAEFYPICSKIGVVESASIDQLWWRASERSCGCAQDEACHTQAQVIQTVFSELQVNVNCNEAAYQRLRSWAPMEAGENAPPRCVVQKRCPANHSCYCGPALAMKQGRS